MVQELKFFSKAGRAQFFVLICMAFSAFVVYTVMYGMRKPYTANAYVGFTQFGISYKVVLVSAQVLGYMISKFIGIRFISTVESHNRSFYILALILAGWLALFFFAWVPFEYKFIFMFLNGLPLGMIWGLVFGYLEGRKTTDFLGAFLAISFIFSSGFAKTVGSWLLLHMEINFWWMPFVAGSMFVVPLIIFNHVLSKSPPPSAEDIALRSVRKPMTAKERKNFIEQFGWLILPAVITYVLLTILRDFCEDFAAELWLETGNSKQSFLFTNMSTLSSIFVLAIVSLFFLIKNNFKAFVAIHQLVFFGFVLCMVSTILFQLGSIQVITWMVLATTGLYLGYVAKNCLYYERMMAAYTIKGNVGFVMYIADAFGYLGTIFVLVLKELAHWTVPWVDFFTWAFYGTGTVGILMVVITLHGFKQKIKLLQHAQ